MKGGHEWWKYAYDDDYDYDFVICPEYRCLYERRKERCQGKTRPA
jgi:hypothetical protein